MRGLSRHPPARSLPRQSSSRCSRSQECLREIPAVHPCFRLKRNRKRPQGLAMVSPQAMFATTTVPGACLDSARPCPHFAAARDVVFKAHTARGLQTQCLAASEVLRGQHFEVLSLGAESKSTRLPALLSPVEAPRHARLTPPSTGTKVSEEAAACEQWRHGRSPCLINLPDQRRLLDQSEATVTACPESNRKGRHSPIDEASLGPTFHVPGTRHKQYLPQEPRGH